MFIHESALPSDERNKAFQNIESFQPICIMIHCFRALETPLAGQNSVNATKTCIKNTFYKPITNVFWKCNLLNAINKSSDTIKYEVLFLL